MEKFKLRKQYSKNYQVVELEVEGNIEEYDTLADWLDSKIKLEMQAIPNDLLTKDSNGGKKYETKSPKQYTRNKTNYVSKDRSEDKDFGTSKQWKIIEENGAVLEDAGYDLRTQPSSYKEMQDMIKVVFNK